MVNVRVVTCRRDSRGKHASEGEATVAIITISRGSFSGGKMLAETLARRLGYRYIDRNQVIRKAAEWGVSQDDLPPHLLAERLIWFKL